MAGTGGHAAAHDGAMLRLWSYYLYMHTHTQHTHTRTCICTHIPQALRFGESCAQIVNRAQLASTCTMHEAIEAIDEALRSCEAGLNNLRRQGRDGLPAYRGMQERHQQLLLKRRSLQAAAWGHGA